MNKLIKILLSLIFVLGLMGCSQKSEHKDTDNEIGSNISENQNYYESQYFEYGDERQLALSYYKILLPKSTYSDQNEYNSLIFKFEIKENQDVKVMINSSIAEYLEQEISNLEDIETAYNFDRNSMMIRLNSHNNDIVYTGQKESSQINNWSALYDQGEGMDGDKKIFDYARYFFFIEDNKEYPCEILVTSSDEVSYDELKNIAQDLMKTIQKND